MRQLAIFFRYRLRELKNTMLRDKRRVAFWIVLLLFPLIMIGSVTGAAGVIAILLKAFPFDATKNAMAAGLFVLFGFTASTNIFITMRQLFGQGYYESIAPLPFSHATVFASKLLEIITRSVMDIIFALPLVVAIGKAFSAEPLHWAAISALLVCLEFISAFAVMSLILAITGFFKRRMAEAIVWIVNVAFVLLFILIQNVPKGAIKNGSAEAFLKFVSFFSNPAFELLPTRWLVDAIYGLASGDMAMACRGAGLILLLTAASGWTAYALFSRYFTRGWQAEKEIERRLEAGSGAGYTGLVGGGGRLFPSLVRREIRTLSRTGQIIYSLLIMPAIFVIFTAADISFGDMGTMPFLVMTIYFSSLNSTLFAFGIEGPAINAIKAMPVGIHQIYFAKYAVYSAANLAVILPGIMAAAWYGKIPSYAFTPAAGSLVVTALLWINLLTLDFSLCFANFKTGGRLKDSISIEGTFALMFFMIGSIAAISYSLVSAPSFAIPCAAAIFAAQFMVHARAVKKYEKGDFS